jgi:hypothetical protein
LQAKLDAYETRTLPFRAANVVGAANRGQLEALKNRMTVEWILAEMPTCYEHLTAADSLTPPSWPSTMSRQVIDTAGTQGHLLTVANGTFMQHPEYWPTAFRDNFVTQVNLRGISSTNLKLRLLLSVTTPGKDNLPGGDIIPPGTGLGQSGFNYPLYGARDLIFAASGAAANANAKVAGNLENLSLIEGAEMLYAILYSTWDESDRRGTHFLTSREIGDTDLDGNPEVLDSFGNPLYFSIRRNLVTSADPNGEDVNENGIFLIPGGDLADTLLNPNKPVDVSQLEIDIHSINL